MLDLTPVHAHTLAGGAQTVTGGPVASQEVIKELGTNGGGFYNVNSAHPFENPTVFMNWLQIYLLLAIAPACGRSRGGRQARVSLSWPPSVMSRLT